MSDNKKAGFFSRLGSIHIHIDGAGQEGLVREIVREYQSEGVPSKMNAITQAALGGQTKQFPREYDSHNPISSTNPALDYFATIDVSGIEDLSTDNPSRLAAARDNCIKCLSSLLPRFSGLTEVVIEVERVVGRIDQKQTATHVSLSAIDNISTNEVGFVVAPSLPIEIHHTFDVPREGKTTPPISLEQLVEQCEAAQITIGGWFFFENQTHWLYRSNLFVANPEETFAVAEWQDDSLRKLLVSNGIRGPAKTIVEQILGIWKFS